MFHCLIELLNDALFIVALFNVSLLDLALFNHNVALFKFALF